MTTKAARPSHTCGACRACNEDASRTLTTTAGDIARVRSGRVGVVEYRIEIPEIRPVVAKISSAAFTAVDGRDASQCYIHGAQQIKDAYQAIRIMYLQTLPIVGWAVKVYWENGEISYATGRGHMETDARRRKVFATRHKACSERDALIRGRFKSWKRIVLVPIRTV